MIGITHLLYYDDGDNRTKRSLEFHLFSLGVSNFIYCIAKAE